MEEQSEVVIQEENLVAETSVESSQQPKTVMQDEESSPMPMRAAVTFGQSFMP